MKHSLFGLAFALVACSDDGGAERRDGGTRHDGGGPDASATADGAVLASDAHAPRADAAQDDGGAPPSDGDDLRYRNGARLERVVFRAPGAFELLTPAWFDKQLATECTLRGDGTGKERCLPVEQDASSYYLDAACTQPLVVLRDPACTREAEPKYVSVASGECTSASVYELAAAPADTSTRPIYRAGAGGACAVASGAQLDVLRQQVGKGLVRTRGAQVDVAIFAAIVSEERTGGVPSLRRSLFEDGSAVTRGFFEGAGARCYVTSSAQAGVCLPRGGLSTDLWTDAACSKPLYRASNASCINTDDSPPGVTVRRGDDVCDPDALPRYFSLGAAYGGATYSTQRCALATPTNETLYDLGAEVTASVFPQVTARRVGSGRLQPREFLDDKGRRVHAEPRVGWVDGQPCFLAHSLGTGFYCVPYKTATLAFADASCSVQVMVAQCADLSPGEHVRVALPAAGAVCDSQEHVRKLGAQRATNATVYYGSSGGSCTAGVNLAPAVFELGNEVPVAELIEFERVH